MTRKRLGLISAHPVKSFFVHMLTRDIELADAILDLLDNCVDGVQRSETKSNLKKKRPYKKYWARINISQKEFSIKDNCGGIPWELHEYAFRMGRLRKDLDKGRRMIGTYGIGMKRAIFKIGTDCTIETHAKDASYRVKITPEWMKDETTWDLEPEEIEAAENRGTLVRIRSLYDTVSRNLKSEKFKEVFYESIATHYAYIIRKGFTVFLNGREVKPKHIRLLFSDTGDAAAARDEIRPFIYETTHQGVDVFLAVGFTRDIPSKAEADDSFENYKERYSSADAGWTIVCNDRTVAYCDKTALTGWGVSGVPQYHMQFIAISGIVSFSSEDADLLPMTTTKRGINAQSEIYLHVRDKMIEGMKIFTNYTNVWKRKELVAESRKRFRETSELQPDDLRRKAAKLKMSTTRGFLPGKQFKPVLPRPATKKTTERISFTRPVKEVRIVSKYLFDVPNKKPSEVGGECFRVILEEAQE